MRHVPVPSRILTAPRFRVKQAVASTSLATPKNRVRMVGALSQLRSARTSNESLVGTTREDQWQTRRSGVRPLRLAFTMCPGALGERDEIATPRSLVRWSVWRHGPKNMEAVTSHRSRETGTIPPTRCRRVYAMSQFTSDNARPRRREFATFNQNCRFATFLPLTY